MKWPRIRCGRCHRVLEAPPRRRTVSRRDRHLIEDNEIPAIERMRRASELTAVSRQLNNQGRVTIKRGVVTAVCRCGFNETYAWAAVEASYLAAQERGEDLFLT